MDPGKTCKVEALVAQCNASIALQQALPVSPVAVRQQQLPSALDEVEREVLLAAAPDEASRAHLRLAAEPGAGSWLSSRPADDLGLVRRCL